MTDFADRFAKVLAPVAAYDSDIRIVANKKFKKCEPSKDFLLVIGNNRDTGLPF